MATIMIFNLPAYGHVRPLANIIKELVDQGDKVISYTVDCYKELTISTGAIYEPCGKDFDELVSLLNHEGGSLNYLYMHAIMGMNLITKIIDDCKKYKPDCIIYDFMCTWGKQVVEITKIPGIAFFPTCVSDMNEINKGHNNSNNKPSHIAKEFELLQKKFIDTNIIISQKYKINCLNFNNLFLNKDNLNLVCTTTEFQKDNEKYDQKYVFIGPQLTQDIYKLEVDSKLISDKVIYISLGTVYSNNKDFYLKCFDAFRNYDYTFILTTGILENTNDLGDIPNNFVVRKFVPQLSILNQSEIFISNGGFNSISDSIYCNVPLIVIPQGADNYQNAERVKELNIGLKINKHDLTVDNLKASVDYILSNQDMFKKNIKIISDSFISACKNNIAITSIHNYINNNKISK